MEILPGRRLQAQIPEMALYQRLCAVAMALGFVCSLGFADAQPLVPALFIFGDSTVDVGNNNHLLTLVKSDFPPYGRDFDTHAPTGRFCNGRLATDYTAETLGFTSFPPAYLSPEATGKRLLTGANFASGASGYDDHTAITYNAIPLLQQLEYYKEYQSKLTKLVGAKKASAIVSGAIYIISAGGSDFVQNYYINPLLLKHYSVPQYISLLQQHLCEFVQNLYSLGARRIGVTTLPPTGCLPAAITLFGHGSNDCVRRLNGDARLYNMRLNGTVKGLGKKLPGLKIAVFDIYTPLYNLVQNPADNGENASSRFVFLYPALNVCIQIGCRRFAEARKACCGTGTIETAILCNEKSIGTCSNATEYVFWDSFHPSQAANQILANSLVLQGIALIG